MSFYYRFGVMDKRALGVEKFLVIAQYIPPNTL
jgi:hypothetical protein